MRISENATCLTERFLKYVSLFFLHSLVSHSPGSNSAAETGRRLVWLEDVQAVSGETFRTDKKPDPANWEYKSLYRGDIARYPSRPLISLVTFFLLRTLSTDCLPVSRG